jgi:hypothetical protein
VEDELTLILGGSGAWGGGKQGRNYMALAWGVQPPEGMCSPHFFFFFFLKSLKFLKIKILLLNFFILSSNLHLPLNFFF